MIIGARTGAWEKAGGWVNPYVTDGLVAMWDGEWNTGGGIHDSNTKVWKDLTAVCGDFAITEHGSFSDSSFETDGVGRAGTCQNVLIEMPQTAEFVFSIKDTKNGGIIVCGWLNENMRAKILLARGLFFGFGGAGSVLNGVSAGTIPTGVIKSTHLNYEQDGTVSSLIINGTETEVTAKGTWYGPTDNSIILGVNNGDTNPKAASLYCIRFYSRNLTSDEIAANYAIDKARFNLP